LALPPLKKSTGFKQIAGLASLESRGLVGHQERKRKIKRKEEKEEDREGKRNNGKKVKE